MPQQSLREFVAALRNAPIIPRPPDESWAELIPRISQEGKVCEVDEETYDYFLDVLPPKYQGFGFAFAEGAEPLRLFWKHQSRFFSRQLTWPETQEFCRLAGINLPN